MRPRTLHKKKACVASMATTKTRTTGLESWVEISFVLDG
jgi:hypothetical protein